MRNQITTLIRRHAVIRPRASKFQQSPLVRTFQYGVNIDQNLSQALRGSLSKQEHLILSSNLSPLLKVQRLQDSTYGLLKEWLGKHSHQVKVSEQLAYQIKLLAAGSIQEMTKVAKEASGLQGQQILKSINLLQSDREAAFRHLQGLIEELERQKYKFTNGQWITKEGVHPYYQKKLLKEGDKLLQIHRYLLEVYLALGRFYSKHKVFQAQKCFQGVVYFFQTEKREQYLHPQRIRINVLIVLVTRQDYSFFSLALDLKYVIEAILKQEKASYTLYPQVLKAASICKDVSKFKTEVNALLDRLLKTVSKFDDKQAIQKITQSIQSMKQ